MSLCTWIPQGSSRVIVMWRMRNPKAAESQVTASRTFDDPVHLLRLLAIVAQALWPLWVTSAATRRVRYLYQWPR
jgi:hypothetical protein